MSALLLGEVDDEGCALSTVPMLVDEGAVHLHGEVGWSSPSPVAAILAPP